MIVLPGTQPATNTAATFLICVDDHKNGNIKGRMYNQYVPDSSNFCDVVQMLEKIESVFNISEFPRGYFQRRTFFERKSCAAPKKKGEKIYMPTEKMLQEQEEKDSFLVAVHFRQNATWQGTISWLGKEKKRNFRSALEMLQLMSEALSYGEGDEDMHEWD